ncbi:MurR/RpiR family transcriptional regulator [Rhodobacteraceae bacterium 2376]|uniref:MurR/RpiR family transcriptional regulator n=1 Tax=Rhabdonatronobacter sediminivivens TaxID=2743469 RepID=A0A7Z0HX86_9RHOB|nr:SIS domain-containing protein [Rhabdonatronobacter sediminivivens]NYS23985.1 MurR/RpiR family transcriptional regulator [Rhabdonatronobacter sediminivivens]
MDQTPSLDSRLREALPTLTRAERQLAAHILGNFPVSVLGSVAAVARAAGVSAPTVVRLVQKLGFSGYPEFQAQLHDELGEKLASPIAKREKWAGTAPQDHILGSFAEQVINNLNATLGQLDPQEFDAVTTLLADGDRHIHMLGGRLSHAMAMYLATALKVMRGDVTLLSSLPNTWPPALLDMRAGDVLVVFDVRRYEPAMQDAAELAREQGAVVVLITDRWMSPAAGVADHIIACHTEAPSAWDSLTPLLGVVEALLAAMQTRHWQDTSARLTRLETLYERMRVFKRGR